MLQLIDRSKIYFYLALLIILLSVHNTKSITFVENYFKIKEFDLIGDADRVLEEIASAFGVPISKLLTNNPNRANAQIADTAWLRDTILPYCVMDEEKLNEKLLPLYGIEDEAFLAYDNPVPEDKSFQLNRRSKYVSAGIMTVNEARREEGLEPIDGGDQLAISEV